MRARTQTGLIMPQRQGWRRSRQGRVGVEEFPVPRPIAAGWNHMAHIVFPHV